MARMNTYSTEDLQKTLRKLLSSDYGEGHPSNKRKRIRLIKEIIQARYNATNLLLGKPLIKLVTTKELLTVMRNDLEPNQDKAKDTYITDRGASIR
jgi:uncharacterized protein YbcI